MDAPHDIFERNLTALRRNNPELAERLQTAGRATLNWQNTPSGSRWATLQISEDGKSLALASRFDPHAEARKLIAHVDFAKHAGIVVLGFGLGYHPALIAEQTNPKGSLLLVYEPDVTLLRAVLETIDHSTWLSMPNVLLLDDTADRAMLLQRLEGFSAILTSGTVLVTHPVARQLHSTRINEFGQMVTDVLAYCRTNVATALVNASRTIRNLTCNLSHYVAGPTTEELLNAARGYPAVCVGAGPSLARNVDLLRDPEIRRNVVIITAQTTLKPLLDRGIRPDFVTALDFHEISRRFYEGLPELPDVTLVAEAKVNPTVIDHYPGPIRVAKSGFLDRLLGPLARPITPIRDGATVAHLSFYLAQHLGCDPILLIGQDLGFSDGLYYCPGTAIHDVWAPEMNAFQTVEMFEWQRIVRHRNHLQKKSDIHARPMYSDEQMLTYLRQFERDFAQAPQRVIDATEGGLPKDHTYRMTLAQALAEHATRPVPKLPLPPRGMDLQRLDAVVELLAHHLQSVVELRQLSTRTQPILQEMLAHQRDERKMERLFAQLDPIQKRVQELHSTFAIVNELNTMGVFRRGRADRAIAQNKGDEFARQAAQLERDIDNVHWLAQACEEAQSIFQEAFDRVQTQQKAGRDQNSSSKAGVR